MPERRFRRRGEGPLCARRSIRGGEAAVYELNRENGRASSMADGEFPLAKYDAMCRAIAEAHAVDEVKDIRDRARAIEIRIRAERRCGELLAETERTQGKRSDLVTSSQAEAKSFKDQRNEYGISRAQAERWQNLAEVPEEEFEATFARSEKPSTTGIINRGSSEKKRDVVDANALWLWGRLLDFELLGADPEEICATIFCDSGYRKPAAGTHHRHPNCPRPRRLGPLRREIGRQPRKRTRKWAGGSRGWAIARGFLLRATAPGLSRPGSVKHTPC